MRFDMGLHDTRALAASDVYLVNSSGSSSARLRFHVINPSSQRRNRSAAGPPAAATASSGVDTCDNHSSATASRRAALLGKWRYTLPWLTPNARATSTTVALFGP
jgi:hypothetical protein